MIEFKVEEKDEYSIVSFELSSVITPEELTSLEPPKVNPTKGVILSGRGQYGFTAILPITIIQQSL